MRLTKERDINGKLNCGLRRCDRCGVEQYLKKPRRWDICVCCLRKELYITGKKAPPKNVKKFTRVNVCQVCNKYYAISTEYLRNQKCCSAKCMGETRKGKPPGNKVWDNVKDRTKYFYEKYKNDPERWLKLLVRGRVKSALKTQANRKKVKYKNIGSVEDLIGCSMEFLQKHIESQFQDGMSWDNWGRYTWHIDHIYPISRINALDEEEIKKVCNYRNLRPIWASDNNKKYNTVIEELDVVLSKEYNYEV